MRDGYKSVTAVKTAYINAKNALEAVKSKQAEWDGVELPVEEMTKTQKAKDKCTQAVGREEGRGSRTAGWK